MDLNFKNNQPCRLTVATYFFRVGTFFLKKAIICRTHTLVCIAHNIIKILYYIIKNNATDLLHIKCWL